MNPSFEKLSSPSTTLRTLGKIGLLAGALSGLALGAALARADVSVNIRLDAPPPPPRHEVVIERERPGADYIWVAGYWDGAPGHYSWVAGHWDRPPHGHAHWVAPRWERDHEGHYRQVRGEWRD